MYEVVKAFCDSKNGHVYKAGDTYPIEGYKPSKARIDELLKGTNKLSTVFLKEVSANTADK